MRPLTFSTLITAHVRTAKTLHLVQDAILTHRDTAPDVHLTILDHDEDELTRSNNWTLREFCDNNDTLYSYTPDTFHQTSWWNEFRRCASTDFIIFSNADVIFHAGWLEQIKEGISQYSTALSWHPVSCNPMHSGVSYIHDPSKLRLGEFCVTANPLCHVIVSRTHGGHIWDEQFPFYEADMDYHLTMERGPHKACVCLGARVDHLDGSSFGNAGTAPEEDRVSARRRLEAKWNLPAIKYD